MPMTGWSPTKHMFTEYNCAAQVLRCHVYSKKLPMVFVNRKWLLCYHQLHSTTIDSVHTLALYLNIYKIQSWRLEGYRPWMGFFLKATWMKFLSWDLWHPLISLREGWIQTLLICHHLLLLCSFQDSPVQLCSVTSAPCLITALSSMIELV